MQKTFQKILLIAALSLSPCCIKAETIEEFTLSIQTYLKILPIKNHFDYLKATLESLKNAPKSTNGTTIFYQEQGIAVFCDAETGNLCTEDELKNRIQVINVMLTKIINCREAIEERLFAR